MYNQPLLFLYSHPPPRPTLFPYTTLFRSMLMRGGTSKGPLFLANDLPADVQTRDQLLLSVMGSPDIRQIDGIGRSEEHTSELQSRRDLVCRLLLEKNNIDRM